MGSLHFPSRREPFAWQINDDSVFLKGRAELIISPITWSGLVEIYSYHLPRTLKILRVMKGPPPAASEPGPPARRGGQGGLPNMAGGGRRRLPARGRVTVLYSSGGLGGALAAAAAAASQPATPHTAALMYRRAQEEPLAGRRAKDNHRTCLNI